MKRLLVLTYLATEWAHSGMVTEQCSEQFFDSMYFLTAQTETTMVRVWRFDSPCQLADPGQTTKVNALSSASTFLVTDPTQTMKVSEEFLDSTMALRKMTC